MPFDSSSDQRLRIRDVWSRPGLTVVRLGGEMDLMSVPVLAARLHALASEHKQQRVLLDLAEVTILEAHAITLLVHVACDDIDVALVPAPARRETRTGERSACTPADGLTAATMSTSRCSSTSRRSPHGR